MGNSESKSNGATVVIHVGPHKTGTTTVQQELGKRASLLEEDGWTYLRPGQFGGLQEGAERKTNVANVASCYTEKTISWVVNQTQVCLDWLEYIDKLRGTSHHVVMSSELFDHGTCNISQLASDLRHVATKIVVVYRPFYEWIASVYRQVNANTISKAGFASWLTDSTMEMWAANRSSTSVYNRYAAHFSDVVMHSLNSSLLANIACDDLGAPRACAFFRRAKMKHANVKRKEDSTGECLSPAQRQTMETISIDLHRTAFGIFVPFPASDFHDQLSNCFGNR